MASSDTIMTLLFLLFLFFSVGMSFPRRGGSAQARRGTDNVISSGEEDNEESYNWKAEQDVMMLAHNAIRKEITGMKQALQCILDRRDVNLEEWEIASLQAWWKGHHAHIKFHCVNEEKHLHPIMLERFLFPSHEMKEHHKDIQDQLKRLSSMIQDVNSKQSVEDLTKVWDEYMDVVVSHFKEEEEKGIASCRKFFHAKEWSVIIRAFFDDGAKEEFGSLIYSMGEDDFRNTFMRQRKIPGFVWRAFFKKNLNYYRTTMVKHMEALTEGVSPT